MLEEYVEFVLAFYWPNLFDKLDIDLDYGNNLFHIDKTVLAYFRFIVVVVILNKRKILPDFASLRVSS